MAEKNGLEGHDETSAFSPVTRAETPITLTPYEESTKVSISPSPSLSPPPSTLPRVTSRDALESALDSRADRLLALATRGLDLEPPATPAPAASAARETLADYDGFAVGRDVDVSLRDDETGAPAWDDTMPGVVVADHGDGTFDVRFDGGAWETLPGAVARLRHPAVGDTVAVYGRAGAVVGLGAVFEAADGFVDVVRVPALDAAMLGPGEAYAPSTSPRWRVPFDRVRRLQPRGAGDDDDENDDGGGSWLDAILCGALSSAAAPARPDRRRSAPL